MSNINDVMICVPTFKRKWPAILSFIRYTDNVKFHLFVRKDDYDAGYYDEPQFKLDNVEFVILEGVRCIGTTRESILQEAIRRGYKYCMMIDDTQYGLHDTSDRIKTFKTMVETCLERFDKDVHRHKAFAFNYSRKAFTNSLDKCEVYFISQLCQTYILNLDIIQKYDLHFKPMDEVGIEDLTFYYEACAKGLVALSDTRFIRIGQTPSTKKTGGCHDGNEKRSEQDVQNERCALLKEYFEKMGYNEPYLKRVDSVLFPGTFYYKLNTRYAREKNLAKLPRVAKINCQ